VIYFHDIDKHCHTCVGTVTHAQYEADIKKDSGYQTCMNVPTPAPGPSTGYKCTVCAHIYNPTTDAAPSPAGTKFEDLPDAWLCPICGAPKSAYVKQAGASGEEVWAHTHDEDEVEEVHA
jgi:rubredoxin